MVLIQNVIAERVHSLQQRPESFAITICATSSLKGKISSIQIIEGTITSIKIFITRSLPVLRCAW